MAIGDVTVIVASSVSKVELLASATATNGVPSGGSAGLAISALTLFGRVPATGAIEIVSTAGSGTMTVTARLWCYGGTYWFPLGNSADGATAGILNAGAAITETSADLIRHIETFTIPTTATRLYLEITAIGGTLTAVTGSVRIAATA